LQAQSPEFKSLSPKKKKEKEREKEVTGEETEEQGMAGTEPLPGLYHSFNLERMAWP
jgi:hypothetical protein